MYVTVGALTENMNDVIHLLFTRKKSYTHGRMKQKRLVGSKTDLLWKGARREREGREGVRGNGVRRETVDSEGSNGN